MRQGQSHFFCLEIFAILVLSFHTTNINPIGKHLKNACLFCRKYFIKYLEVI